MSDMEAAARKALDKLAAGLADKGLLIEAGWASLRAAAVPLDAPKVQLDEMRNAFFAGAQHLLGAMMQFLEPGEEPTRKDMRRMDRIAKELETFGEQLKARVSVPEAPPFRPSQPQTPTLGDAPIEGAYQEAMVEMARFLDHHFNGEAKGGARKTGFVLLVFPVGSGNGRCNYISNGADRRDVVVLLKEQLARFEGQAEVSGRA